MKINPSQTQGLERILDQTLGSGTTIRTIPGAGIQLMPGAQDQIQIAQIDNRLQITVNKEQKITLSARESQNLAIEGTLRNIQVDPNVVLPIQGWKPGGDQDAPASGPGTQTDSKRIADGSTTSDAEDAAFRNIGATASQSATASTAAARSRKMEGAIGTTVTQQIIASELKEDPFIGHLGKQIHKLFDQLGSDYRPPAPYRTEADLLPALANLEKLTAASKQGLALSPILTDLNSHLRGILNQMKKGAGADLEVLGESLNTALRQLLYQGAAPRISDLQPGKIPLEARNVPIGVSQREALLVSRSINEAIGKNDLEMIGNLIADGKSLAFELPEEKGFFARSIAQAILAPQTPEIGRIPLRGSLNEILQSTKNGEEFAKILDAGGSTNIMNALKSGFADFPARKLISDFNFLAGVMDLPDAAIDLKEAQIARELTSQGYAPLEIINARKVLGELFPQMDGQKGISFPPGIRENIFHAVDTPLLMNVSTPGEKAEMIRTLQQGYVSPQVERTVVSILQSASGKPEFDAIVNQADLATFGKDFSDAVAITQWNQLVGGYGRLDLAQNPREASILQGVLLEDAGYASPMPALSPISIPILQRQNFENVKSAISQFLSDMNGRLQNFASIPDRRAMVESILQNTLFQAEGKPLFDSAILRGEVNKMLGDWNGNVQGLVNGLKTLQEAAGLTNQQMRNIITQPLRAIYSDALEISQDIGRNVQAFFSQNRAEAQVVFGLKSREYKSIQSAGESVVSTLEGFNQKLGTISAGLNQLYPAQPDWFLTMSDFVSNFQTKLGPAFLEVFPENGAALTQSSLQGEMLKIAAAGNWNVLTSELPKLAEEPSNIAVRDLAEVLNGRNDVQILQIIQSFAPPSSPLNQISTNLFAGIQVNDWVRTGKLENSFIQLTDEVNRTPGLPAGFGSFVKQGTAFFNSIATGSFAEVLKSIIEHTRRFADPIADSVKTTAEEGVHFLTSLQSNRFDSLQREFAQELRQLFIEPSSQWAREFFANIASFLGTFLPPKPVPETEILTESIGQMTPGFMAMPAPDAGEVLFDISSGKARGALAAIAKSSARLSESPVFRNLIDVIQNGGNFVRALRTGNLIQTLDLMNGRFGNSPAISQIIQRGLHLSTTGTMAVQSLVGRDFERPVAQMVRRAQAKTEAAKEMAEAQGILSGTAGFFYALSNVEYLDTLWQFQRQLNVLRDKVLIDTAIRDFERLSREFANGPELHKNLMQERVRFHQQHLLHTSI